MPRVLWPLRHHRPHIEITLPLAAGGQPLLRHLFADTGAGSLQSIFELVLAEADCLLCGGNALQPVMLGGAYAGTFPIYGISVRIPKLGFALNLRAVGVPSAPAGFDGIACFKFLNRFQYGNFGNPSVFGLES